jgi:hypothetical protein
MPNPAIKDEEKYEALRREGNSEQKSARIANASAGQGSKTVSRKGGKAGSYEDWTKKELTERAAEIGIDGRSGMTKDELVEALRNS